MSNKFFTRDGRYGTMTTSRYFDFTYGENAITAQVDELKEEAHGTYGVLLFDKRWIEKRKEILARDDEACVICKGKKDLQIHHRQYHYVKALKQFKAPWDYENHLMITLCDRCHTHGHSKYKIPKIYL